MKLIKTKPAKKSYAVYNIGAKAGQYALVDDRGATLFTIRGRIYTGERRAVFNLFREGGSPLSLFSGHLRDCVAHAHRVFEKEQLPA